MTRARLAFFLVTSLTTGVLTGASCSSSGSSSSSSGHGASGASSTSGTSGSTRSSGAGGSCAARMETFGVCEGATPPDGGGPGAPGTACTTDSDCTLVCCLCPEGQTRYAYGACTCGQCTSVCDPSNDYRAPVCLDGGPVTAGCFRCSQILNEAFAEGEQLGSLACTGEAATTWNALATCANASCDGGCEGGIMPTNDCVGCIERQDDAGGCAAELTACQAH